MRARLKCQGGERSRGLFCPSGPNLPGSRTLPLVAAVALWLLAGGAAHAQGAGYMRIVTASGRQMAGESTDPAHYGWIPVREATMPSASEIGAAAPESKPDSAAAAAKSVNRPVVVIKDRDKSSLGLLGAMTSHQHFPEVEIVLTKADEPLARYRLTDVTIISIRAGGARDAMEAPMEQLRFNYAKIEIER
jgi:type VI secretion system Hcp family effector